MVLQKMGLLHKRGKSSKKTETRSRSLKRKTLHSLSLSLQCSNSRGSLCAPFAASAALRARRCSSVSTERRWRTCVKLCLILDEEERVKKKKRSSFFFFCLSRRTFFPSSSWNQASGPHLVDHPPVAGVVADPDGALPLAQAHAIGHHGSVRLADPGEPSTQRDEERADGRRRRSRGHLFFCFEFVSFSV